MVDLFLSIIYSIAHIALIINYKCNPLSENITHTNICTKRIKTVYKTIHIKSNNTEKKYICIIFYMLMILIKHILNNLTSLLWAYSTHVLQFGP